MTREQEYLSALEIRTIIDRLEYLRPLVSRGPINISKLAELLIVKKFVKSLTDAGFNLKFLPLGHDFGHLLRDSIHAILAGQDKKILNGIDTLDLFAGSFGGSFHDVGLILHEFIELTQKIFGFIPISRYEEKNNYMRHAEYMVYLIDKFLDLSSLNLSSIDEEYLKLAIKYAVAAHTNYLTSFTVDGKILNPYKSTWQDGSPIWFVILTRWCDRMDCIGPYFTIRHFTTLLYHKEKKTTDYSMINGKRVFCDIDFKNHMYPFKPKNKEQKSQATMRSHLEMFLNSQNNETPYGKDDILGSIMVSMREYYKDLGWEIINALDSTEDVNPKFNSRNLFNLIKKVSRHPKDDQIWELVNEFENLPNESKIPWRRAFRVIRKQISNLAISKRKEAEDLVKIMLN